MFDVFGFYAARNKDFLDILIMGIVIGATNWFIFQNLVLRDAWAIWLATRKNLPTILLPVGLLAGAAVVLAIVWAIILAGAEVISRVHFDWWVGPALVVAIGIGVIWIIGRKLQSLPVWPF